MLPTISYLKSLFFLIFLFTFVSLMQANESDLFEAAFQGECRVSNPCQQLCFDLHDGTFECACHDGFHLNLDGYSCHKQNTSINISPISTILPSLSPKLELFENTRLPEAASSEENIDIEDESHPVIAFEKPLYSCEDVECEAGGVCTESQHQTPRVRCRCALGRGGQFCERIIEIQNPEFRGTSYLALPTLRNAHRSMQLQLEFKPESFNGVLLYSGQAPDLSGDFIAIVINQGFVEFRFDCGMGLGILRSDLPIFINSWNTLTIFRDGRNAWMQVNQGQQIFGHSKGLFSRITFRLETFLGGSPNISQIQDRAGIDKGLVGCVRKLKINDQTYDFNRDTIDGIDVDQCKSDACSGVNCLNDAHCALDDLRRQTCICPLGFTGQFCEIETKFLIPAFNGSSYLQTVGLGRDSTLHTEIELLIKPTTSEGLLLYNGQRMDKTGDFLSISLSNSFVELRFDLGSGAAVIQSEKPLQLGEWHTIRVSRTGREGVLQVDDQLPSMGLSLGAFTQASLPLNLYLGGVPSLKQIHRNVQCERLFEGCIQRAIINGRELDFERDILTGANIHNCEHKCNDMPCKNNGHCRPKKNWFSCHCGHGYIGVNCEKSISLESHLNEFKHRPQSLMEESLKNHYKKFTKFYESQLRLESIENQKKKEESTKHEEGEKKKLQISATSNSLLPMFYGNSFLKYNSSTIGPKMIGFETVFHLTLRAFSSRGLILWLGSLRLHDSKNNYFSLGLEGGHLEMNVNLGSGNHRVLFNASRIDDGQWHRVYVARYGKQIMVRIDDNSVMQNSILGTRIRLDATATLFLGGLEDTALESKSLYEKGYIGCIANLTIGELHEIALIGQAERGSNIRSCI